MTFARGRAESAKLSSDAEWVFGRGHAGKLARTGLVGVEAPIGCRTCCHLLYLTGGMSGLPLDADWIEQVAVIMEAGALVEPLQPRGRMGREGRIGGELRLELGLQIRVG